MMVSFIAVSVQEVTDTVLVFDDAVPTVNYTGFKVKDCNLIQYRLIFIYLCEKYLYVVSFEFVLNLK
jgi:hypothetical protein